MLLANPTKKEPKSYLKKEDRDHLHTELKTKIHFYMIIFCWNFIATFSADSKSAKNSAFL